MDEPKPVSGEWVEWEDVPEPEPEELTVHRFAGGDVETAEEPSGQDD